MATTSRSASDGAGEQIEVEMPEFLRIPPSDIKIGDQIGRGGFSTVHKATWDGKQCAVKVVQTADVLAIQKEVSILSELSHPHIMGCIGFSVDSIGDPNRCMILMELMESDLRHLMNERLKNVAEDASPFSETEAVNILCQISSGMEYLHVEGVFHGDLKLVSYDCDGKLLVKITDFGVSQMVKLNPAEKPEKFMKKKHFQGAVGTRGYQAPEVSSSSVIFDNGYAQSVTRQYRGPEDYQRKLKVSKRKSKEFYSARADIYCFAMTCYEIFSGRIPFESVMNRDIPARVLKGERPKLPHGLDGSLVDLKEMCWDQKPSKRPKFGEIKRLLENWEVCSQSSNLEMWRKRVGLLKSTIMTSLQDSRYQSRKEAPRGILQDSLQDRGSKDQSRMKAPKCWGRLLRRFRRGNRK